MISRPVATVARWEYHRFAKPRDLVLGVIFFMVVFGIFGFVGELLKSKGQEEKTIGVLGGGAMGLTAVDSLERFYLEPFSETRHDDPQAAAEAALESEDIDALLVVAAPDRARLVVREERGWQAEFLALVTRHRQAMRLRESGVDPRVLQSIGAPVDFQRVRFKQEADATRRADPKTVIIVVSTMLVGLFLGFSYVFVAITGEKTQKVTESVLAAISPQEWIDGKILGLTLVVLVNVVGYAIGYLLYKGIATVFFGLPFNLPAGIEDPLAVTYLLLFAVLGFGFWFTLFAVVAATINDPNSSSRSSLLFLPFIPLGLTLMGIDQPDALWMRLLALIPGLSPAAMPVRILRGDPHLLEILLSVALLVIMVAVFRRTAGRVFGVSMLMTGKEPSWREVWRWVREA